MFMYYEHSKWLLCLLYLEIYRTDKWVVNAKWVVCDCIIKLDNRFLKATPEYKTRRSHAEIIFANIYINSQTPPSKQTLELGLLAGCVDLRMPVWLEVHGRAFGVYWHLIGEYMTIMKRFGPGTIFVDCLQAATIESLPNDQTTTKGEPITIRHTTENINVFKTQ